MQNLRISSSLRFFFFLISAGAPASAQENLIPRLGPAPAVKAPVPEVDRLIGKVPLWHVPSHRTPLVSATVLLPCGAADDPPGKAGLAALTAAMLNEGAGSRGALELADELDLLGASLRASADRESSRITLLVLRRNLEPALNLLADVLMRPRFEDKEWQRVKTLWINRLNQEKDNPMLAAKVAGDRIAFGDRHPYGLPAAGLAETVKGLSLDDLKQFYGRFWRPEGAAVVSAGDAAIAELKSHLEERLKGWEGIGPAPPQLGSPSRPVPSFPNGPRPRLAAVHKPQAPQTTIRVLAPGIARTDPAYLPLSLANAILGGTFTSRLIQNLRESHGYTYGVSSAFSKLHGQGVFVAASSVSTDVTAESIHEFAGEFRRVTSAPFSAEEMEKARATLRNNIVEGLETVAGTASLFVELAEAGLPPDEIKRHLEGLNRATLKEVQEAASRIIDWDKATIVLVGDLQAIRKEIAEIDPEGLSALSVLDAEGAPINGAASR